MNENERSTNWTVIVVTAPDRESAYAFDHGLSFVLNQIFIDFFFWFDQFFENDNVMD